MPRYPAHLSESCDRENTSHVVGGALLPDVPTCSRAPITFDLEQPLTVRATSPCAELTFDARRADTKPAGDRVHPRQRRQ